MKIVKEIKTGVLFKVTNEEAKEATESGNYTYSNKNAYKSQVNQSVKIFKSRKYLDNRGGAQAASDENKLQKDSEGTGYYKDNSDTFRKILPKPKKSKTVTPVQKQEPVDLKYKSLEPFRAVITKVEKIGKGIIDITAIIDDVPQVRRYKTVKEAVIALKELSKN